MKYGREFCQNRCSGHFCMTRDAEEFTVGGRIRCREYTSPRNDLSSEPEGWIREGTKVGLVVEVKTNHHQGKPGIEKRIESLSGENAQSLARISNGFNKFGTDSTQNIFVCRAMKRTSQQERSNPVPKN